MPIDKYLEKLEGARASNKKFNPLPTFSIENTKSYIILEGRSDGSYSYPDLLVATDRSHCYKDWYEAHESLHKENSFMLNLWQFVDYLRLLRTGKVFNANGNYLDSRKLEVILNVLLKIRNPYRAEWLDAYFKVDPTNNSLTINYDHRTVNGKLVPIHKKEIIKFSVETEGIDLDSWLSSSINIHGLPYFSAIKGSTYYYTPTRDKDSVARFFANCIDSGLHCSIQPFNFDDFIEVRAAKLK